MADAQVPEEVIPDFLIELEEEVQAFMESAGLNSDTPEALTDRETLIDYYLKKIQALNLRAAMNQELRDRQHRIQDDWLEEENRKLKSQAGWIEQKILLNMPGDLVAFQKEFGLTKRDKSRKLPHGKIGFRSSRDRVTIQDQTLAVAWARTNDVEVKEEVTLATKPAKAYIDSTGDMPDPETDGLTFVPGEEKRYIAANAD